MTCSRRDRTDLASGLVRIKVVVSLLNSSSLWLPLHIGLNTNDSVDLRLDWEITRLGELSSAGGRTSRLTVSTILYSGVGETYSSRVGDCWGLLVTLTGDLLFEIVDGFHYVLLSILICDGRKKRKWGYECVHVYIVALT